MPKHLNIQFVIADGSCARWVKRSENADDFKTVQETQAGPDLYDSQPQGVVFESSTSRRFNVGERDEAVRHRQAQFPEAVADAISAQAAAGAFDRLAIVAPARTLSVIRRRLSPPARAMLVKTLAKDLTKTPDHELGAWLRPLEFG
jgi:protein required for attachment to host cells